MTALVIGCFGQAATEQRLDQFVQSILPVKHRVMRILRTTNPVGGRALFVIPTLEHIEQHAIRLVGNIKFRRNVIERFKQLEMNEREAMFAALQRRQIFDNVTLVHNNNPESTPISDYDFLIYLDNPSPGSIDWYIKTKGEPFGVMTIGDGVCTPLGYKRTSYGRTIIETYLGSVQSDTPQMVSWLDSIEELARTDKTVSSGTKMTPVVPSPGYADSRMTRWALCVGVSRYQYAGKGGLTDLPFAADDATEFASWLEQAGWRHSHIKCLTDKQATERDVRIALESWLTKAKTGDLIVLYWAGHGFPDPEDPEKVYFACHDTDVRVPATGYRMDRIRKTLEERNARNVVILADTCHAGKLITRGDRGLSVVPSIKRMQQDNKVPKGWVFMVSADTDRKAVEHSSWRNGAFTHCLLKGLRGEADGFQSAGANDGVVTLGELREYLTTAMPDETQKVLGVAKHPLITTSSGDPSIWNLVLQGK